MAAQIQLGSPSIAEDCRLVARLQHHTAAKLPCQIELSLPHKPQRFIDQQGLLCSIIFTCCDALSSGEC